jgi:DUF917 family protein
MQSFIEWMEENHSEELQEGFLKNFAVGSSILGAGLLGGQYINKNLGSVPQKPAITQSNIDWHDYVSPDGIKIGMSENGAVVSMPTELANKYGANVQKKALMSLGNYLQKKNWLWFISNNE